VLTTGTTKRGLSIYCRFEAAVWSPNKLLFVSTRGPAVTTLCLRSFIAYDHVVRSW
jgi:hypothetical protein